MFFNGELFREARRNLENRVRIFVTWNDFISPFSRSIIVRRNTLRRSLAVTLRAKVSFLGDKKRKLKINGKYSLKSIDDHALCSPLTVLR